MNNIQTSEALKNLKEWKTAGCFSVGGFDYMGFSESDSNKPDMTLSISVLPAWYIGGMFRQSFKTSGISCIGTVLFPWIGVKSDPFLLYGELCP